VGGQKVGLPSVALVLDVVDGKNIRGSYVQSDIGELEMAF
jgi:hypothetical protein